MAKDYYDILGVPRSADLGQIKQAYRSLAKEYHPDKNPGNKAAEEHFKLVNDAYNTLADPDQRETYDLSLEVANVHVYETRYRERPPAYYAYTVQQSAEQEETYSKATKVKAGIFVGGLIFIVLGFTFGLQYFASEHYFDQGKTFYEDGNLMAALSNLDMALRDLGARNKDAAEIAAIITLYKYDEPKTALYYIDHGLKFAKDKQTKARFYYWKGLCSKRLYHYPVAIYCFQKAMQYQPVNDSALIELGQIYAYSMCDYDKGKAYFAEVKDNSQYIQDALFGLGYCNYHLKNYFEALVHFQSYTRIQPDDPRGHYILGLSKVKLNQNTSACTDFQKANDLGMTEAQAILYQYCESG